MFIDVYGDTLCAMVSAAALASTGHQVVLHVSERGVANSLNEDSFTLREPGLADLMAEQPVRPLQSIRRQRQPQHGTALTRQYTAWPRPRARPWRTAVTFNCGGAISRSTCSNSFLPRHSSSASSS